MTEDELDAPPERDDATIDIFGGPAPVAPVAEPQAAYTVIARKYRPRRFEDLIGQEAMVRTLTNAFALGRIAHAFMLTGVRGVGKTTTARLLARALNYETDTIDAPSVTDLGVEGRHCRAIIEGRHLDVLELDAASRSKVDDMRELLDGVRYAPAQARYKVYIIDEVHMLSTAAFNALLKTLEEPPPHAKFIFATTEIRKVPVTILSRCQRFDLRRVEAEVIAANLKIIAEAEGVRVEDEALLQIGRAAEGSVRDAQSLLDQALVQAEGVITAEAVRDMLGLADRGRTIALFEAVVRGEAKVAIELFRDLFAKGADPVVIALDLLEHAHAASIAKTLGPEALGLPKEQAQPLTALGAGLSAGTLSRLWQMLLKGHEEIRRAPAPEQAMEMLIIRLAYAADLPGPEEALKAFREGEALGGPGPRPSGGGGGGAATAQALAPRIAMAGPRLDSFTDLNRLLQEKRDIRLRLDVETYLRPIAWREEVITIALAPGAPADLTPRLVAQLKAWTGKTWRISIEGGGGGETALEAQRREVAEVQNAVRADPFVKAVLDRFPGAEIVDIRRLAPAEPEIAPAPEEEDDD
jgi:DNA polymerase III subunit gamma/tau